MFMRILVLLFVVALGTATHLGDDGLITNHEFYIGVLHYKNSNELTKPLSALLERLRSIPISTCLSGIENSAICSMEYARSTICTLCGGIVETVLQYYHDGYSPDEVAELLLDMCIVMELQSERVCRGMIDFNKDLAFYIIDNKPTLQPDDVCGVVFQGSKCGVQDNSTDWSIDVDMGEKPKFSFTERQKQTEILTVLQITDIHYDPMYITGSNAVCDAPMCCHPDDGQPATTEDSAGAWGDYRNCDLPLNAVISMMNHIKLNYPEIDYVYFTGDIIDHAVWRTSVEYINSSFNTIYTLFKEYFGNVPVYSTIGNHESHPVNVFSPMDISNTNLSTKWLYESLIEYWSMWVPKDNLTTVLQGGHYTTLIRPGLRLIAINNIYCYTYNFWLIYESKDLGGQLTWLANTLLEAEMNNEKVHILAHMTTSSSGCLHAWSKEFRRIIDRFEGTVVAIFNGHTHHDEFHIFYSVDNPTHPTCVAFNGGSATPASFLNPNYRVYKVDAITGAVLDYDTWVYNLTEANLYPEKDPEWYKMYSFLEAYGVNSLTPSSLDALTHRMAAEPELIHLYRRYFVKEADPLLAEGCDEECLSDNLCNIVVTYPLDTTQCDILKAELNETLNINRSY